MTTSDWLFDLKFVRAGLAYIDESTPHVVRLSLLNSPSIEGALAPRLAGEWRWEPADYQDGHVVGELVSTFSPRTAALFRPLWALKNAGVGVAECEMLDLEDGISERALQKAISAWGAMANKGPHRRRLEALAGERLLEMALRLAVEGPDRQLHASRFAVTCISFNTPGSERRLLKLAEASDKKLAEQWVAAAIDRSRLTALSGGDPDIPQDALSILIGRPGYLGERAVELLPLLSAPPDESLLEILCTASRGDDSRAEAALTAMISAPATERIKDALRDALDSSSTRRRAGALPPFAAHWPDEARPYWIEFLASRSGPLREVAEVVIPRRGGPQDIPLVAAHVSKLIRSKHPTVVYVPPRGSELISMLVANSRHPDAQRALDDVASRWNRLYPELRAWLETNHGSISPVGRTVPPSGIDSEPEERLMWPPPEVELESDGVLVWYEYTDMFETRESFERLMGMHSDVELIDGDREWLRFTTNADDPRALVLDLWERAGGSRA